MNLSKNKYLKDNKVRAIIISVVILGLYFSGSIPGMYGTDIDRPITNYGDWYLYVDSTGDSISAGTVIEAEDGLKVTLVPDSLTYLPDTLTCKLYRPGAVWEFVELGVGGFQTSAYIWRFDLDATVLGVDSYFIVFFGEDGDYFVSGETYTFQINNEQTPIYKDPEIKERPIDAHFDLMESPANLRWKYISYSSSVITVTVNGVIDITEPTGLVGVENIFIYVVDTSVDGTQNIVFRVTPVDANNQAVSDSVMVVVEQASTTTTDTTTTDTTTTDTTTTDTGTTTTTEPPEPEPISPIIILGAFALASVVLIFVVLRRRGGGGVTY